MDFIDGTMYIKHDGQFKPFMKLHNGCVHAEGHQSKAEGDYLFKDIKSDTKPKIFIDNSNILELQNKITELGSQMEDVIAAIRELREEIDKINNKDMFDRYFGVDYSKSSDF